jgi:flagellar basal body rod protein FlgG
LIGLTALFGAQPDTLDTLQKSIAQVHTNGFPQQLAQFMYILAQARIDFRHASALSDTK